MTLSEESMANYPEGTFDGRKVTIGGKTYLKIYEKALDDAGRKWSANDKRYLNPLPTDQLVLNKNLTQNRDGKNEISHLNCDFFKWEMCQHGTSPFLV